METKEPDHRETHESASYRSDFLHASVYVVFLRIVSFKNNADDSIDLDDQISLLVAR